MAVQSPTRSCPRCEASVPQDARFCASCGRALEGPTPVEEEQRARLSAAAPRPLVDKMRAARLTGERKPVTALFADVVGSTALAEQMDPEDWTAMINEAFDLMSQAVFRYEGTIAQLQGDAMLAFFGAPVAHEDDPERAVLAAIDMIAATEAFAGELRADRGIEFRIRAGINTGPVVVGNVGSDLRYEYTALGDAMNVAARMQAAAEPGTILVTHSTRRLIGDAFDLEDLGDIEVKGKREPVHAYRVLGRKQEPRRKRGLQQAGLESPMVGRDEPMRRLEDAFEVVRAGSGRVAFVVGEPGIGKSRLLAELRQRLVASSTDAGPPIWVEGRCVSYGRSLPYHLLIDLVRSILGMSFSATEADARTVLDEGLEALLGADWADAAPYLAHLLSLPLRPEEDARAAIEPDVMQERYIATTHRLLRALARRGPVVVVCEDVHWADQASIEVARQVMPLASQHPILFVGALRAETESAGWALIAQARNLFGDALIEIQLEPLNAEDSRTLVANLLEIESLPSRVRELILARAEGNPFFVEEVVRMLMERGVIVPQGERWVATADIASTEIPETLHGLLLARIDQLPESAKRSLRIASVIGRQFPVRVLERVLGTAEQADQHAGEDSRDR
jgi:class 3 adenylate cyclase